MEYIKKYVFIKNVLLAFILFSICFMIDAKPVEASTIVKIDGMESQEFEEPFVAWNYAIAINQILPAKPAISITLDRDWNCIDKDDNDKYSGALGSGVVAHDMGIRDKISTINYYSNVNQIKISVNNLDVQFDASSLNMQPAMMMRYCSGLINNNILGYTSDGTINVPADANITLNLNGHRITRPDVKLPVFHVDGKLNLEGSGMVIGGRAKSLGTNVEVGAKGSLSVNKNVKIDLDELDVEELETKDYYALIKDTESGKVINTKSQISMYFVWNHAVLYSLKNKKPVTVTLYKDWAGFKDGSIWIDSEMNYDMGKGKLGVSLSISKVSAFCSDETLSASKLAGLSFNVVPAFQSSGSIRVPEGADITLDLNGHTITRDLSAKEAGGEIFSIEGKLSIVNSKAGIKPASIKGGSSTDKGGQFVVKEKGSLYIENCYLEDGVATDGGCFYCNGGKIQLENCFLYSIKATQTNSGNGRGGMLYMDKGSLEANDCTFYIGRAQNGGFAYNIGGSIQIKSSSIKEMEAEARGGGFYLSGSANSCIIEDCEVQRCTAREREDSVGGFIFHEAGDLTIKHCQIYGPCAKFQGGFLFENVRGNTTTKINNTSLISSTVDDVKGYGGGIYYAAGNLRLNNMKAEACSAKKGGAIYINNNDCHINICDIESCTADEGAGIFVAGGKRLCLKDKIVVIGNRCNKMWYESNIALENASGKAYLEDTGIKLESDFDIHFIGTPTDWTFVKNTPEYLFNNGFYKINQDHHNNPEVSYTAKQTMVVGAYSGSVFGQNRIMLFILIAVSLLAIVGLVFYTKKRKNAN